MLSGLGSVLGRNTTHNYNVHTSGTHAFMTRWGVPQMLLEAQQMHDKLLDMRVQCAINNNRLVRLDSILVAQRFADLQQRADRLLGRA